MKGKLWAVSLLMCWFSNAVGAEVDDVIACAVAAKSATGVDIDMTAGVWESSWFSPNKVRWSNVYCELENGSRVSQLKIDGKVIIVDSYYGESAKQLMAETKRRVDGALAELKLREDYLIQQQGVIELELKSPSPESDKARVRLDDALRNVFSNQDAPIGKVVAFSNAEVQTEKARLARKLVGIPSEDEKRELIGARLREATKRENKGLAYSELDAIFDCETQTKIKLNYPDTFERIGSADVKVYPNEGMIVQLNFRAKNAFGIPGRNKASCRFGTRGIEEVVVK